MQGFNSACPARFAEHTEQGAPQSHRESTTGACFAQKTDRRERIEGCAAEETSNRGECPMSGQLNRRASDTRKIRRFSTTDQMHLPGFEQGCNTRGRREEARWHLEGSQPFHLQSQGTLRLVRVRRAIALGRAVVQANLEARRRTYRGFAKLRRQRDRAQPALRPWASRRANSLSCLVEQGTKPQLALCSGAHSDR